MRNKCVTNHVMKRDSKYYYVRHIPKDLTQHYSIQRLCSIILIKAILLMDIKEEWKDIIYIIILVTFKFFPLREHFL